MGSFGQNNYYYFIRTGIGKNLIIGSGSFDYVILLSKLQFWVIVLFSSHSRGGTRIIS